MALKTLKEQFEAVLVDWAAARGFPADEARLDADGQVSLVLDNAVGTLVYREASDTVILWFESGNWESASFPHEALIANDRFALSRGFTVAIDPATDRVVVHDRRPAECFASAELLDAWLAAGAALSADVRHVALFGLEPMAESEV